MSNEWEAYYNDIFQLNSLVVPRHVTVPNYSKIEVHGFADSSLTAYGAAIYVRSINEEGKILSRLLCAKTRVARTETIPKLELRAALLLAVLYIKVNKALKCKFQNKYFWSDSNVALAWIKSKRRDKLTCFVKNQVNKINSLTDSKDWYWVASGDNPADLLTRGLRADKLASCPLWWQGPLWLQEPSTEWPFNQEKITNSILESNDPIETFCNVCISTYNNQFMTNLFEKWSDVNKLIRCFAYIFRFINNCKNKNKKIIGPLYVNELNDSRNKLIKFAQIESYPTEYQLLMKGR